MDLSFSHECNQSSTSSMGLGVVEENNFAKQMAVSNEYVRISGL